MATLLSITIVVYPSLDAGGPTFVGGSIVVDTTWTQDNSPYVVGGNVTIRPGANLTIEAGTAILFNFSKGLFVEGTLRVQGSISSPVTFTSNLDPKKIGDWIGIKFNDTSDGTGSYVEYAAIEYAYVGVWCDHSSPMVANSTISNIKSKGILLEYSNSTVSGNTIMNVADKGIEAFQGSPIISGNTIQNSTYYGFKGIQTFAVMGWNTIQDTMKGIYLLESAAVISNTSISSVLDAVYLENSPNSQVYYTTISNTNYGIYAVFSNVTDVRETSVLNAHFSFYFMSSKSIVKDCTIDGTPMWNFYLQGDSIVTAVNISVMDSKVWLSGGSSLTIRNYLDVTVTDKAGDPLENATVSVTDNDVVAHNGTTNHEGRIPTVLLTDRVFSGSSFPVDNVTIVEVALDALEFEDNPRSVDMGSSHHETFAVMNIRPIVNVTHPDQNSTLAGVVSVLGTSTDEDGVVVLVEVRIDFLAWLVANETSANYSVWNLSIDTEPWPNGNRTIEVRCLDDDGAYSEIVHFLTRFENPNDLPEVTITSPENGASVWGITVVSGSATDPDGSVVIVEVRLGDGQWQTATQSTDDWSSWSLTFNASHFSEGDYTIRARAIDDDSGTSYHEVAVRFDRDAEDGREREDSLLLLWNALILVALVLVFVVAIWLVFARIRRKALGEPEAQDELQIETELQDEERIKRLHEAYEAGGIPEAVYLRNLELLGGESKQAAVEEEAVTAYECPECGNRVTADAKECDGCGAEFLE